MMEEVEEEEAFFHHRPVPIPPQKNSTPKPSEDPIPSEIEHQNEPTIQPINLSSGFATSENNPASINYKSTNTANPRPILKKSNSSSSIPQQTQVQTTSLQKSAFCTKCGLSILYVPVADEETKVRCYECVKISVFRGDGTTFASAELKSNTDTNARTNVGKGSDINAKFKGAFKTLQRSQFVKSAKEKSSLAAQKTREAAQNLKTKNAKPKSDHPTPAASPASPTSAGPGSSPPTPVKKSEYAIFGESLEEGIRKSAIINPGVPDIVTKCIEYIREKAINEEGVFRLSGSAQTIKDLKAAFNSGKSLSR